MSKLAPFLLAAALVAGPASATRPAPHPDTRTDKVICRSEARVGTRLATKQCFTMAQWAEIRRASRDLTEWLQQTADIAGSK